MNELMANVFEWLAILGEEIGEANQASLHDRFGGKASGTVRTELIHAIAVGVAFVSTDRRSGMATTMFVPIAWIVRYSEAF